MTIHSLYIYDRYIWPHFERDNVDPQPSRHCTCIYYQDWHRTKRPKPAVEGGILVAVSQAVSPVPATTGEGNGSSSAFSSPSNLLSSTTGTVVALNEGTNQLSTLPQPQTGTISSTELPFDEEAKLVYGVVISLRNMIKKLSGR
jgi:hypothetical protein